MPADLPLVHRVATGADVEAAVALIQSAYRGDEAARGWSSEAALLGGQRTDAAEIRDLIARPGSELVLGEQPTGPPSSHPGEAPSQPGADRQLVSCFHLALREDGTAYFGMFAVRPDLQAAGLGRRVLAEAERRAAAGGATMMVMTVISVRTELIAWYGRRGYRNTGRTEPFPYSDERKGQPLRSDLEFAILEKSLGDPPGTRPGFAVPGEQP